MYTHSEQHLLQSKLARFLISDVFNMVTEDDILKEYTPGVISYKGNALTPGEIAVIRKDIAAFMKTRAAEILLGEIRYHGKQARDKAATEADLITTAMLGYLADVLESKMKKLATVGEKKALPSRPRI